MIIIIIESYVPPLVELQRKCQTMSMRRTHICSVYKNYFIDMFPKEKGRHELF